MLTPFFCFSHGHLFLTKAHFVVFLLFSLLQRVIVFLISLFIFISISSSLFLQTLMQHVFVNLAYPFLLFFTWPSVTHKSTCCHFPPYFFCLTSHIPPYFSSSAHHLPYFFKLLVFLLTSSNPNATHLCQPCSPFLLLFTWQSITHKSTSCRCLLYFSSSMSRLPPYFLISLR